MTKRPEKFTKQVPEEIVRDLVYKDEQYGEKVKLTPKKKDLPELNITKVRIWAPEPVHYHRLGKEVVRNEGEAKAIIFLDDDVYEFLPGEIIAIPCGMRHAIKPWCHGGEVRYLRITVPAAGRKDIVYDPCGKSWGKKFVPQTGG